MDIKIPWCPRSLSHFSSCIKRHSSCVGKGVCMCVIVSVALCEELQINDNDFRYLYVIIIFLIRFKIRKNQGKVCLAHVL